MERTEMSDESIADKEWNLAQKAKRELGFMKKGAKVLPKVIAQKAKGWAVGQYAAAKERAQFEKQLEEEAKKAEQQAYKTARIKQAQEKGRQAGEKKASGGSGILASFRDAGERLNMSDILGFQEPSVSPQQAKTQAQKSPIMDTGSVLFEGLGDFGNKPLQQPKQPTSRVEIHHYHHHKKRRH
jgi:hypothetical protein